MTTSSRPERLFVYGTLLASAGHPLGELLSRKGRLVGRGSIRARLYMIDDPDDPGQNFYPGALPSPDPADRVHGEVHEVLAPDEVFPAFDDYEACGPTWEEPHEFALRLIEVTMEAGPPLWAGSYLYTWDVSGARRIASGRFTDHAPHTR